jgi:hypothetical protein
VLIDSKQHKINIHIHTRKERKTQTKKEKHAPSGEVWDQGHLSLHLELGADNFVQVLFHEDEWDVVNVRDVVHLCMPIDRIKCGKARVK